MATPILSPLAERITAAKGWDGTLREIMLASKALPVLPETLRTEDNRVVGCQSNVWLAEYQQKSAAWSDSKVIRGVLAVLLEKANGVEKLTASDFHAYLTSLGMARYLSESRTSGIRHVINQLVSLR